MKLYNKPLCAEIDTGGSCQALSIGTLHIQRTISQSVQFVLLFILLFVLFTTVFSWSLPFHFPSSRAAFLSPSIPLSLP